MKNVLIALDYSPSAQQVAEAGYALASDMHAQVMLLHVISDPSYYSSTAYSPIMGFGGYMDPEYLQPNILDGIKTASQHFLDKTKNHLGDETIKTFVEEGDFGDSILAFAKKLQADIIVMGSHSRNWIEGVMMGSVTEKVLRHTTVPLFVVPFKKQD